MCSVLGPLLFLIYINDIESIGLNCLPNLFADDTLLYYIDEDPLVNAINGQEDLSKLREYFRLNKLTWNVGKTKFMNIHSRRKVSPNVRLDYDGVSVEEVEEFKYLGIVIDKHVTFERHIRFLCSKLSSRIGILRKLSKFLPKKVLLLLYFSMVHFHLNYLQQFVILNLYKFSKIES